MTVPLQSGYRMYSSDDLNNAYVNVTGPTGAAGATGATGAAGATGPTGAAVASSSVPASAAATGTAGHIAYDATHLYVCVATDTWVRVDIASW